MEIQVKPASVGDQDFLRTLFHEVRFPEFAPLGLAAPMLEQMLDMQHRAQTIGYAARFPKAVDSIVCSDGERIGRMMTSRDADGTHLIDVALLQRHRGLGVGTYLLSHLCNDARADHVAVTLRVKVGNPAEHLYTRLGFEPVTGDGQYLTMRWKASANV